MRAVIDLIENLTHAVRLVIAVLLLFPLLYGVYLAIIPPAPDQENARDYARSAIVVSQQHALAEEGWGYSATTAAVGGQPGAPQDNADDGWAD